MSWLLNCWDWNQLSRWRKSRVIRSGRGDEGRRGRGGDGQHAHRHLLHLLELPIKWKFEARYLVTVISLALLPEDWKVTQNCWVDLLTYSLRSLLLTYLPSSHALFSFLLTFLPSFPAALLFQPFVNYSLSITHLFYYLLFSIFLLLYHRLSFPDLGWLRTMWSWRRLLIKECSPSMDLYSQKVYRW